MMRSKEARDAYVDAEITTALAHQIRALRTDRNLTQAQLAKLMRTTQAAISRLEDPSYGKLSLQTLLELSHTFDTGLRVEFVSTLTMLNATYKPKEAARHVPTFTEEAEGVIFYSSPASSPPPKQMVHEKIFRTGNPELTFATTQGITATAKNYLTGNLRILESEINDNSCFQDRSIDSRSSCTA